jgi:hypothetical protein
MIGELLATGIGCGVGDIDTLVGKLVVNGLPLVLGTDHRYLAPAAGNQRTRSFDDPRIMSLGERHTTTTGLSPSFEPFKKAHNSSPAAIVTQRR